MHMGATSQRFLVSAERLEQRRVGMQRSEFMREGQQLGCFFGFWRFASDKGWRSDSSVGHGQTAMVSIDRERVCKLACEGPDVLEVGPKQLGAADCALGRGFGASFGVRRVHVRAFFSVV